MFRGHQPGEPRIRALTLHWQVLQPEGAEGARPTFISGRRASGPLSLGLPLALRPAAHLFLGGGSSTCRGPRRGRDSRAAHLRAQAPCRVGRRKLLSQVRRVVRVCSQERENALALLRRKEFSPQFFIGNIFIYAAMQKDRLYSETLPSPCVTRQPARPQSLLVLLCFKVNGAESKR